MTHTNIKPGMLLKLTKDAIERYGENSPCQAYLCTGLKFHGHYKVPYIQCGSLFFKPVDFEKCIGWDLKGLAMANHALGQSDKPSHVATVLP